jgi:hypothetical protein
MLARAQEVGADIVARKEVNGKNFAFLPEQKDTLTVGHCDVSDFGAYPTRARLEDERAYLGLSH